MQIKSVTFKNYKKVPNGTIEFKDSGLYVFRAQTEQGKTSAINAISYLMQALDPTPVPTTLGKTSGNILGVYKTNKGEIVEVSEVVETNGKTKFSMTYNDIKENSVTSIRDLFNITNISMDKFLALGETAEGRRKQLEYILNILSNEDKINFYELKDKEKKLFEERTEVNRDVKKLTTLLQTNKLSEEEITFLSQKEEIQKLLNKLNTDLNNIEIEKQKKKNLEQSKEIFKSNTAIALHQIKDEFDINTMQEFNNIVNKIITLYDNDINNIEIVDTSIIQERIKIGKQKIEELNKIEIKQGIYLENEKENKILIEKQKKLNAEIDKVRTDLEQFFENKQFPIPELVISSAEEGLSIKTEYGILPFNSTQLSTSQVMMIVLKIMYYINKNTNIIFLGRLESFDEDKMNTLIKFAKEFKVQIISDEVVKKSDNFVVDVYYDVDQFENIYTVPIPQSQKIDIPQKIENRKLKEQETISLEIPKEVENKEQKEEKINDFLSQETLF